MGAGFVVAILLARQYGPEGLGLITTASASVVIVLGFSALGLSGVLVRELVEKYPNRGMIILTVSLAKLAAGAVLLGALVLGLRMFAKDPSVVSLALIMGAGYLFSALDPVDALYNAQEDFVRLVAFRLAALTVSTAVKLGAIVFDWGLEYVALGYALDYALVYVLPTLGFLVRPRGGVRDPDFRFGVDFQELVALLKRSWPVLVSGGFAQINLRSDALLIAALASIADVGLYAAASRLSEAWSVLAMALVTATFPGLVKLARTDVSSYGVRLSSLLRQLIWLSLAGGVAVTLFAHWIIELLYGPEFAPAAVILSIHIFGGVFLFIRTAVSRWLIVEELLMFSLVSHAAGALVNVALNLVLVPTIGIVGAAWASVVSYATSGFLFLLLSQRTRTMFWMICWSALPERLVRGRVEALAAVMAERRVQ
ncbi:flippase [Mycolicibacterium mengxianglii]|uniref:flippase n=1 Tax=Mycolicibacterium mengxianglii TaxID=2736649 RepID=UPI0018EF13A9|nr:flippase [Mycolicibacterium mengxianglii]